MVHACGYYTKFGMFYPIADIPNINAINYLPTWIFSNISFLPLYTFYSILFSISFRMQCVYKSIMFSSQKYSLSFRRMLFMYDTDTHTGTHNIHSVPDLDVQTYKTVPSSEITY